MRISLFILLIIGLSWSCESNPQGNWGTLSLLEYDVPITVKVPNPDSIVVKKDDLGPIQDITLDGPDNYSLQIYTSGANTNDVLKVKSEQLDLVKEQMYFNEIVEEEDAGFIFENLIDSISSYGFRYVVIKGNKQIVLQNHLSKLYSKEDVTEIYNGVKQNDQK